MQKKEQSLNRLVSLTFDESPAVRKNAAKELGEIDDPAALFALFELSYDKDVGVKNAALDILEGKKARKQEEAMSFSEIFSPKNQEPEQKATENIPMTAREKVLQPITKLFERRLSKEKADRLRSKMMPAIEKMYMKSVSTPSAAENDSEKKAVQEFLTSYLEAVSDMSQSAMQAQPALSQQIPQEFGVHEELAVDLETIGTKEAVLDNCSKEIAVVESADLAEIKEENDLEKLPDTIFKKAYETMMLAGGDEEVMRSEMRRLTRNYEKEVKLAYSLAKKKFKETKLTHITKIRDNMRNVNTEELIVKEAEHKEYAKTKKSTATYTRVIVNDEEGDEGVVYLFDGRGSVLRAGMKVKIVRGQVKTFDFSHETALTIGAKGNVYIVL